MNSQKIKNYLFSFFPYRWLRHTKKKISLSYLLFGPAKRNVGRYLNQQADASFALHGMADELGNEVVNGFRSCFNAYMERSGFMREYVLECRNCIIEPQYGWGIDTATNNLIFDSIPYNAWMENYHPSYFHYIKNKDHATIYPELISIRLIRGGEQNYWHFLHDLLGQVVLAKKHLPNAVNLPYLISEKLANQPFFNKALQQSRYLSSLQWIVQQKQYYVKAGKAYFLQVQPNKKENFLAVRRLFDLPLANGTSGKRIFLTRNPKRIRHLNNAVEIGNIARQYGFDVVDTDLLTMEQQMALFRDTRYLIGIHGAGLTNMIFRSGGNMHLLELLPQDYVQPHYFWLSKDLGFQYTCVIGTPSSSDTSFSVSAGIFKQKVQEMLKLEAPKSFEEEPKTSFNR